MRTKIILVLAIIMGLVTTVLFYKYMMQFDQEVIVNETLVDIVVAKQEIPENRRITAELLEIATVSQTGIHPQTQTDLSELIGKYATSDITAGEQILSHRVSYEKEESLFISRKVKEGFRALSIGVNFVQSVSNLIEPGDWVDVVFTEKDQETNELESEILLERVYVLAVGRRMLESRPESEYVEYSSATLELRAQDSIKLINASEKGTIQLIVHSRISEREGTSNAR